MDISIVMGTYNRLPILKRCIAAVRRSVTGLDYEIIVVDGGSTDGTIPWLKEQPNVICVEQGELLGAVRAYNAGFRLARAPFVCHINDDDIVQEDCIRKGLWYIQDRHSVGQVAFAFDLWDPNYGFDGVFGITYANKGITRRELGDRAQWWDEQYYTYAADTELSCRIAEMGYKIAPLHECKAHDLKTHDELRERNNPGGANTTDSPLFYKTRKGIDKSPPQNRRVLHYALNTPQDNQPALERALRSMGPYRQIDRPKFSIEAGARELARQCEEWDPALVFMQLQHPIALTPEQVARIKAPGRTIVNWSGDVQVPMPGWYAELGADLTLVTNETWVEKLRAQGIAADYLQVGFNQEIFHPWGRKREIEPIIFLGSTYGIFPLSQERRDMVEFLRKRYGEGFGVYGTGWRFPTGKLDWYEEAAAYRSCKIAIGHSQVELKRYTSDRLFRAMGSGAFYLTRWYPGIEKDFNQLMPDKHLECWQNLDELTEMIDYYLAHDEVREKTARAGSELVHREHAWLDRIYQLTDLIGWHQWR